MTQPGEAAREAAESATAKSAAERLTFFSDAVVAIAITLLAIELPVPEGSTPDELWASFQHNFYAFGAFLISFAVIGSHWFTHHRVFRYVHRTDGWITRLNMVWLLVIVLTPFLTRVVVEGDKIDALRFGAYAAAQALQMATMALMIYLMGRDGWFEPTAPPSLTSRGYLRSLYSALGFALSIPVFFLVGNYAFFTWAVVPSVLGRLTLAFLQRDDDDTGHDHRHHDEHRHDEHRHDEHRHDGQRHEDSR